MQRLTERYRPALAEVVGQPAVNHLRRFAAEPYACAFLLEGEAGGTGKTSTALALAAELGCHDEWSGLVSIAGSELNIEGS